MCIEEEFECDMQAYGSCDKVLMREMRMEILIVVSVLTCDVIVHLCTCAFSVVMSMQCVHAHDRSGIHSYFTRGMCVCVHTIVYSHLNLLAAGHEPHGEVRKLCLRHGGLWSGVASEVGHLLGLDVGHVGVRLGLLVRLLEPALFCGVASALLVHGDDGECVASIFARKIVA